MSGPPPNKLALATDWFELLALTQRGARLGRSRMREAVSDQAPDLDEAAVEALVDDVLAEVDRRANLSGALYPFARTDTGLQRRIVSPEVQLLYSFFVLCSAYAPFRRNVTGFEPGRVFERIAAQALKAWTAGHAIVFADIAASGVRARIDRLGQDLRVTSYSAKARKSRKDHGLDIAAWRGFPDRRAGHPIVLCQCTIAWKLVDKARDIQVGEWGAMLDVREGSFSAALATPHALEPDYQHWDELRRNSDLILERTRILALLTKVPDPWAPLVAGAKRVTAGLAAWQTAQFE